MLKITRISESVDCVTLQLEGRIGGVWIDELRHECMTYLTQGCTLTLDLSGVQFVEAPGIVMLRAMLDQPIQYWLLAFSVWTVVSGTGVKQAVCFSACLKSYLIHFRFELPISI